MLVSDFRKQLHEAGRRSTGHLKQIVCNSGLTLSVQASAFNYCTPRESILDTTAYTEFEVGFPSEKVEAFMEYAENPEDLTESVYGWVPHQVIQQVIIDNGGIKEFVSPY